METRAWQAHWHSHAGVRTGDQLWLGKRAADRMRNMMTSWPFMFCLFGVMTLWALVTTWLLVLVIH